MVDACSGGNDGRRGRVVVVVKEERETERQRERKKEILYTATNKQTNRVTRD